MVVETAEVVPTEIVRSEKFNLHGPQITLQEGKVAVQSPNGGHEYVLGEKVYQQEIVYLKLKLEAFGNNCWLFIGIVKEDSVQHNDCYSYSCPGSYGWALGWSGHMWKNGSRTDDNLSKNLSKQGKMVELVLDCDAAKL